jgi:hypothetical protein
LSVNDFKRMNNEPYIRITLSNLVALLARANVVVRSKYYSTKSKYVVNRSIK